MDLIIKMAMKKKLLFLKIKLQACFRILFGHEHWFMISMDSENLRNLISENDFEAKMLYHKLVRYNIKKICKNIVCDMDEVDWILEKAKFEAESEEFNQNRLK